VTAPVIRAAHERDVERAGDVNFVASYRGAVAHGMPPIVGSPDDSRRYVRHLLALDPLGGFVAEDDGRLVGLGWVHPRGPVATVGPLAVDPEVQGRGIGRQLLERLLEAAGPGVPQVRLVHESYNTVALGLCLRSGFRVVAPLLLLELPAGGAPPAAPPVPGGLAVRHAEPADAARVVQRDARAFGAARAQSVDGHLARGRVLVAERGTMLAGYALGLAFDRLAHLGAASADDADVLLLLLGTLAAELATPSVAVRVLVPATDRRVVDGMIAFGFRVLLACQYMVRGGGTAPPANYVLMNGDLM
jgi:GNAT superfamily N-acetyltransferase